MKSIIIFTALFATPLIFLQARLLNKTIATVNHKMIFLNQLADTKKEIKHSNLPDSLRDILYKNKNLLQNNKLLLDYLITRQLIFNKIRKYNLIVKASKVNSYVEKIRNNYNLTDIQFAKLLKEKNIDYTEYKKNIKNKLEINQFLRQFISPKIQISKAEIQNYIHKTKQKLPSLDTQYKLLHIVTKNKNITNVDFSPWLTIVYSEISQKMKNLINKINKKQKPQLIKIGKKYHLVKIQSITKIQSTAYKNAFGKIKSQLFDKKFQFVLKDWIKSEKKSSHIKIFL